MFIIMQPETASQDHLKKQLEESLAHLQASQKWLMDLYDDRNVPRRLSPEKVAMVRFLLQ